MSSLLIGYRDLKPVILIGNLTRAHTRDFTNLVKLPRMKWGSRLGTDRYRHFRPAPEPVPDRRSYPEPVPEVGTGTGSRNRNRYRKRYQ